MLQRWFRQDVRACCGQLVRLALIICLLLPTGGLRAAEEALDTDTDDERLYREALFLLKRGDTLEALTLLESDLSDTSRSKNPYHNQNHVLAMEAGLDLGLYSLVDQIADHLELTAPDRKLKQHALFSRIKIAYLQGRWGDVERLLAKDRAGVPEARADEVAFYQADSLLRSGRNVDAARVLSKISSESLWGAYGYFNLATAYHRAKQISRALVAFRVGASLTDTSTEGFALKDRILVTAGKVALDSKDPAKAISFLEDVRVDSSSTPAAILLLGEAQIATDRRRTGIQTWYAAKKFSLLLPGVADVFMAIPYAYEEENLRATAIDAWSESVGVFEGELRQIEALREEIGKTGVLALLDSVKASDQGVEWFLATNLATNTPRIGFAFHLMADEDFLPQAQTLRQLNTLQRSLDQTLLRLDALVSVLERRVQRGGSSTSVDAAVSRESINQIILERNQIVQSWQRLADGPIREAAAEPIKALDRSLQALRTRYARLSAQGANRSDYFATRLDSLRSLRDEVTAARAGMVEEVRANEQRLGEMAEARLSAHAERMRAYKVRAELALVNLFDEMAVEELEKSAEVERVNAPLLAPEKQP